jgi:hypothetical protein
MPEKQTLERARRDQREGKSPSTQAGEFVREEMHHIREGKHGARSPEQAIAIGLSKARRSGVKLPPPRRGQTSSRTRRQAERDIALTGCLDGSQARRAFGGIAQSSLSTGKKSCSTAWSKAAVSKSPVQFRGESTARAKSVRVKS